MQTAFQFRADHYQVYGIAFPMYAPWTSRVQTLDVLFDMFDATAKVVEHKAANDPPVSIKDQLPSSQLPDLASLLFQGFSERISYFARLETSYLDMKLCC